MRDVSQIKEAYHCAKCRGTACVVHHTTIPRDAFPLPVGRYLVTTCALCGYTEFYDLAVLEHLEHPAASKAAPGDSRMEPS
jgi:predicted nucleic-acid-binding Zn-ribbon protein